MTTLLLQHTCKFAGVSAAAVTFAAAVTDKQNLALAHIRCAQAEM